MTIYRLVPAAAPDDPGWDRALNQGEVVVLAHSSGEARAIAALEEASQLVGRVPLSITQVIASAFRDEKLYSVHETAGTGFEDTGPARVLRGEFSFPDNFVVHVD